MAEHLLDSRQMAQFAARGFLRLDAVVPEAMNRRFLDGLDSDPGRSPADYYDATRRADVIPTVAAGTPLEDAYLPGTPLADIMNLPPVAGAVASLVGSDCVFDHHFLHVAFPAESWRAAGQEQVSQLTHQDSTIDPRRAFDIQIMYYPHEVTREMGGTRFVPGTHLRIVSESSIGRYQNIRGQEHVVCPPGTLLFMHMGIWHGGGLNRSDALRFMFKIRLCPRRRQCRLWDTSDLGEEHFRQRPIFWSRPDTDRGDDARDPVQAILTRPEPWFEADTGRLEYLARIRFWRYLLGDDRFDADYWLTRVENDYD